MARRALAIGAGIALVGGVAVLTTRRGGSLAAAVLDDVLGILTGNQFGRELWKYLVLGAFFFLLAEIALSRWIAVSRRTGEEIKIDFESREAPTTGFKEQLARVKGAKA